MISTQIVLSSFPTFQFLAVISSQNQDWMGDWDQVSLSQLQHLLKARSQMVIISEMTCYQYINRKIINELRSPFIYSIRSEEFFSNQTFYYNPINQTVKLLSRLVMPSIKSKKNNKKQGNSLAETQPEKLIPKIKFNFSADNLRPFVEGPGSIKTPRKPPRFEELCQNNAKTPRAEQTAYISRSLAARDNRSPDIAREVSNQILSKIEENGVKFKWQQLQQTKTQWQDDHCSNMAVWNQPQKMMSIASTIDFHPLLYPTYFQFGDFNYQEKCRVDPFYFVIEPMNLEKDQRTTLMIKNIPNKYTIEFLAEEIDRQHSNTYDFLYLPCDMKNNCNVGYGFINFVTNEDLKRFYFSFHCKRWGKFKSEKICQLTYARLQGLDSLIEHFQNSKVLSHKEKKYHPIIREFESIEHLIRQQKSKVYQPEAQ